MTNYLMHFPTECYTMNEFRKPMLYPLSYGSMNSSPPNTSAQRARDAGEE